VENPGCLGFSAGSVRQAGTGLCARRGDAARGLLHVRRGRRLIPAGASRLILNQNMQGKNAG